MSKPRLHYIYDPLCGWCYAAELLVDAAQDAGFDIAIAGGNLFEQATSLHPAKRAAIRSADRRIADLTGQTFGSAYLNEALADPDHVWWSTPVIAGILAAETLDPAAGLPMLKAVQRAHYVAGRKVIELPTLADLASGIGLNRHDFEEVYPNVPVSEHVRRTRHLMARNSVASFPTFLLERDGQFHRIPHENVYGQPHAFLALLRDRL